MTDNQKIAYEWAKSHDYPSIAARYARELAGLVDDLHGAYDAMARDLAARTRQVRQLQEENAALRQKDAADKDVGKWISVKDRLPDEDGSYLVTECVGNIWFTSVARYTHKYNGLEVHLIDKAIWYDFDSEYGDFEKVGITHWMPLPEPPEEGAE